MTSQILKSVDLTKTQKSRYLENEALFFLQRKKIINCTSRVKFEDDPVPKKVNLMTDTQGSFHRLIKKLHSTCIKKGI